MPEQHRLIDIIISALKEAAASHDGKRVVSARLKIGERASVTPEIVQTCFDRAVADKGLDGVRLDIQIVPILGRCSTCECIVEIDSNLCCKRCGKPYVEIGDPNMILVEACQFG